MKYRLLESLLPHLEAYERLYPQQAPQLHHFAVWLARQSTEADTGASPRSVESAPATSIDAANAQLLAFLYRYARTYAKKALEGAVLGTMDEFAYLNTLFSQGPMSKSDLIQIHRHEKPTGMEIIRRLLAMGLIDQRDDVHDRRSKVLSPTEAGRAMLNQTSANMGKAAQLLMGNLTPSEKMALYQLLEKLEQFHQVVQAKMK